MLDGDIAGREAAEDIAKRLVRRVHVRIIELPDGVQPDQLDQEGIDWVFGG